MGKELEALGHRASMDRAVVMTVPARFRFARVLLEPDRIDVIQVPMAPVELSQAL